MVIAPKEYSRRRAARGIEVSGVRCTGKVTEVGMQDDVIINDCSAAARPSGGLIA